MSTVPPIPTVETANLRLRCPRLDASAAHTALPRGAHITTQTQTVAARQRVRRITEACA